MVIDPPRDDVRRLTDEVAACGLEPNQFTVEYSDLLQSTEVIISHIPADAAEDMFACLASIQRQGQVVTIVDAVASARLYTAYQTAYGAADREALRQTATQALARLGKYDDRPLFDSSTESVSNFISRAARFCELPDGAVQITDDHYLQMSPDVARFPISAAIQNGLTCFFMLMALDDALSSTMGGLGWIGNEANAADAAPVQPMPGGV